MHEVIQEKVSVLTAYDRMKGIVLPKKIRWQGREYCINKLGYYHKRKTGRIIFHIFDVTDGTLSFRLACNSETLHWTLEEVSDGTPS